MSFKMALNIKYLVINSSKEIKDIYSVNYKTLIKKAEDNSKKWKYFSCFWIGKINIVKMSITLKSLYRFKQSLEKYPWHFSHN